MRLAAGLLLVHNVRYRIELNLQWCKVDRDEKQTHDTRKPLLPSMKSGKRRQYIQ